MTSLAQFTDAMGALNAAEAFHAAAQLDAIMGKVPPARELSELLLNVAAGFDGSFEQLTDASRVDEAKIGLAVGTVARSTVLEVSEFVMLMKQMPRYRAS